MKNVALTFAFLSIVSSIGLAQQSIDKSIQFPPGMGFRNYHIYIPSGYDKNVPHKLLVGFHPFDKNRWDGGSWRDSLITFAENANLLLICPDGGSDGRIDDSLDYEFIKVIIDSMHVWYNIDVLSRFAVGFSVGGKAVYEYGLNNRSTFKGAIPIGAAMNGTETVDDVLYRAKCMNFYIIHGQQDSPNQRFIPIKDSLEAHGANVDVTLMAGVGHTFDFPNRNQFLMLAFRYIDTASCDYTGVDENKIEKEIKVYPTLLDRGQSFFIEQPYGEKSMKITVFDVKGAMKKPAITWKSETLIEVATKTFGSGMHIVILEGPFGFHQQKILIR